jgi:hypothetical protein
MQKLHEQIAPCFWKQEAFKDWTFVGFLAYAIKAHPLGLCAGDAMCLLRGTD